MHIERQLEINEGRHFAAEARQVDKLDRQLDQADRLIGELNREGKPVLYINMLTKDGVPTGKIKEGTRHELVSYLIRNRYV